MAQQRPDSYEYNPWFKLYSAGWLGGSIRFDCTVEERSVFADFLSMANESRNRGWLQASTSVPYPLPWLATKLNIDLELLERCIEKFKVQGRITVDGRGIYLTSFGYYQNLNTRKRGRPPKNQGHRGLPPLTAEETEEHDRFSDYQVRCGTGFRAFRKEHDRGADGIEEYRIRLEASEATGYRLEENRFLVRLSEMEDAFEEEHGRGPDDTEKLALGRQATEETGFDPDAGRGGPQ